MKRNRTHKLLTTGLLTLSCIGILLTGCGKGDKETKTENAGQEITEADIKVPDPSSEQDIEEEPKPENPAQDNPPGDAVQTEPQETDTLSLYEQFLHNDLPATIGKGFPQEEYRAPICETGASYTLSELGDKVSVYFLDPEYTDKTSYDSIEYAYVNSSDGTDKKHLLVKFVGLNIYAPDDLS